MAVVFGMINGKLSSLLRSGLPSINFNLRTLMSLRRKITDQSSFTLSISPNIANVTNANDITTDTKKNLLNDIDSMNICLGRLSHLETMQHSALYYSNYIQQNRADNGLVNTYKLKPLSDVNIELPSEYKDQIVIDEPRDNRNKGDTLYINPVPALKIIYDPLLPQTVPVKEAPNGATEVKKEAKRQHRMLKIRKRKMKVHRRKRLWKRMWSVWKKKFFHREKRREIEFRQKLIDKVQAAEKFNAEAYVDDYLEDLKCELTPKTYKRRNKPEWLIKELMERDVQVERRKHLNNTNMLTKEPLIRKGESVVEFVDRTWR